MSEMPLIYLADLTHTTITISNDSFPLNVGLVAAFAKIRFPEVGIELFKYPEDLKTAIDRCAPDILGLSNYPWNHHLGRSFLQYARQQNPEIITVMGGPNISFLAGEQVTMLRELEGKLDFYIMHEGESGFAELLGALKEHSYDVEKTKSGMLRGSIFLHGGRFSGYAPIIRSSALDEYPSPYICGLLDKFFDDKLSPMIETHRGCPFRCTYCHEGHKSYNKVNRFALERIFEELDYIAEHIGPTVKNLLIADPNFGMFERDINIAEKINQLACKQGFPKSVFATTAKNSNKKIINITKQLRGVVLPIWMSLQSMAPEVLQNIRRKNISMEDMLNIQTELEREGAVSKSELIIPLPGETLETHLDALVRLINLGIGQIVCYQLMLVNGSELKMDLAMRTMHRFVTRFRVLSRNFTTIPGMGSSIEREEVVVSTRDFSFSDYLVARKYHLLISIFYNGNVLNGFFRLAIEAEVDIMSLLKALLGEFEGDALLGRVLDSFMADTESELFDTEADLDAYYREDENFKRLMHGENGANLLQKYASICYLQYGCNIVTVMERTLLACIGDAWQEKIRDVAQYYRLSFEKFLDPDRLNVVSKGFFRYDISCWLSSDGTIEDYRMNMEQEVLFRTPIEQYEMVEAYFQRYGRDAQAMGKVLTRIWIVEMLRKELHKITI